MLKIPFMLRILFLLMFQVLLILRTHYFSSKDKKNSLNVLFSNVDTLSNKCSELEATLSIENTHVIGLCEIYPKNCFDKSVASKLDLYDYEKYLPDKLGDRGVELCYIFISP